MFWRYHAFKQVTQWVVCGVCHISNAGSFPGELGASTARVTGASIPGVSKGLRADRAAAVGECQPPTEALSRSTGS